MYKLNYWLDGQLEACELCYLSEARQLCSEWIGFDALTARTIAWHIQGPGYEDFGVWERVV